MLTNPKDPLKLDVKLNTHTPLNNSLYNLKNNMILYHINLFLHVISYLQYK